MTDIDHMKQVGIEEIEFFLPEKCITSGDLAKDFGFPISFIENKVGVKKIFISGKDENTSDLAVEAVKKIFINRPYLKDNLGLLAVCTQTPDFTLPHTSAIVQKKLGLQNNVACFDLGLGCSGFVYGLSIAKAFMEANEIDYGLLVTAETYSKIIDDKDRNTKALFSDAAAATLLSRSPHLVSGKFTFGTDGEGYNSLILKPGSSLNISEPCLSMDGRRIFEFVASVIPEDVKNCLLLNEVEASDIDSFVFHQASAFMLDALSKRLGIPKSKITNNISRFGNTVSSSIPIALKTDCNISSSSPARICISGFGVGLSWSSTILTASRGDSHV
jgi:3-oxoacyl-[acyl-carrier-protein] synthase-3